MIHQMTDHQLRALRDGAARDELERRRQERREADRARAEQEREQAALAALRGLSDDDLRALASDPRTTRKPSKRWKHVPNAVWDAGWSKDDVVEEAARVLQERVEQEAARREEQFAAPISMGQPFRVGGVAVPRDLALVAVVLAVAYAVDRL